MSLLGLRRLLGPRDDERLDQLVDELTPRLCETRDLACGVDPFSTVRSWWWSCRHCNAGGHVFSDGTVLRHRRDVWDAARGHVAGGRVCRPRVVLAPGLQRRGPCPWTWCCPVHGFSGLTTSWASASAAADAAFVHAVTAQADAAAANGGA